MNTRLMRALLLFLISIRAFAESPEANDFQLPSATEVGQALGTLCSGEAQGVKLALAGRVENKTIEYMLARMPAPTDPALRSIFRGIRRTVEDVYAHPEIGYATMFYYRSKVCFRERTELHVLPRIEASIPGLLTCERQHGRDSSAPLLACVARLVGELP